MLCSEQEIKMFLFNAQKAIPKIMSMGRKMLHGQLVKKLLAQVNQNPQTNHMINLLAQP